MIGGLNFVQKCIMKFPNEPFNKLKIFFKHLQSNDFKFKKGSKETYISGKKYYHFVTV